MYSTCFRLLFVIRCRPISSDTSKNVLLSTFNFCGGGTVVFPTTRSCRASTAEARAK